MFDHVLGVLPQFALASLALAALPGPASLLCLQRTLRDGRIAGLAAVAGNEIGVFAWAIAGGAGLSMLLTANRVLLDVFHVVGGVTLIVLGLRAWRGAGNADPDELGKSPTGSLRRGRTPGSAFRVSLVSIAANPKAAVFGISFLPQFLPRTGPQVVTLVALAGIQVLVDGAWTAGLVLLAGRTVTLWRRIAVRAWLERILGAILVAVGVELAVDWQ
jgi:threonine/homoserine/homoserine lactone efflux protein